MGGVSNAFKTVYKPIFAGALHLFDDDGLLGGLFGGKKAKVPNVPAPPQFDQLEAYKAAQAAALLKKKAADSATGYEDLQKTPKTGLGGIPSAYQGGKQLTGT